jgi:hypothetical protein
MALSRASAALAFVILTATPVWPAEHPALAKARMLYNAGEFDAAIDSAQVSRAQPDSADASALVIARSHLERYRQRADAADLTLARETLVTVRPEALTPRDRLDLLIGLGQSLFFGELFGAAAELFDTALSSAGPLSEGERRQLLDWWASSIDRDAQVRPFHLRAALFSRLTSRMEDELRKDAGCAVANYWLAVAARGAGDVDRAWSAAVAGWVRAPLRQETSQSLRADLDRLVTEALIPERVRARPASEQPDMLVTLTAEWDLVKRQWR